MCWRCQSCLKGFQLHDNEILMPASQLSPPAADRHSTWHTCRKLQLQRPLWKKSLQAYVSELCKYLNTKSSTMLCFRQVLFSVCCLTQFTDFVWLHLREKLQVWKRIKTEQSFISPNLINYVNLTQIYLMGLYDLTIQTFHVALSNFNLTIYNWAGRKILNHTWVFQNSLLWFCVSRLKIHSLIVNVGGFGSASVECNPAARKHNCNTTTAVRLFNGVKPDTKKNSSTQQTQNLNQCTMMHFLKQNINDLYFQFKSSFQLKIWWQSVCVVQYVFSYGKL